MDNGILNVAPGASPYNSVDAARRDPKVLRYGSLLFAIGKPAACHKDILLSQLRQVILFAFAGMFERTLFPNTVANIVTLSSCKQMFGATTSRLVAMMANAFCRWNGAIYQFKSEPMSVDTDGGFSGPSNLNQAVALSCLGASPKPTIARLVNFAPESVDKLSRKLHNGPPWLWTQYTMSHRGCQDGLV